MRRLRVLHLIGAAKPGGAETFALRLMAALHAHPAIEQQVLCRTGGWLAGQLKAQNIPHTTMLQLAQQQLARLQLLGLNNLVDQEDRPLHIDRLLR
jgi:hypothetical protein